MLRKSAIPLVFAALTLLPVGANAQDMAVSGATISGSLSGGVLVSAQPIHAQGPQAISLLAVEIAGDDAVWNYTGLNDQGAGGDAVAGDGVWSVAADMSNAAPGTYSLKVYVVDANGAEFISDATAVSLN